MRVHVILALALLGLAAPAAAQSNNGLWVELPANKRPFISIPSVSPLVERAQPAVLVVLSEGVNNDGGEMPPGHPPMPNGPMTQGQGSGFLIHPSGLALTNNHVVEGASKITVRVGRSRREISATLIGADPRTDVALLQLGGDRKDWPFLPLGSADKLKVGDFVVAIGNPFGLANSVSMGILSGRGRRDVNPSGRMGLYDFLQTDASINFGNSGGPLLNLAGEVVGVNTAINAAAQGIGFAIPVDMIKRMIPALKKDGRISRAWIGVGIQDVSPALARSVGLVGPRGALIQRVLDDGPAGAAGVLPGDIILTFDGEEIDDSSELPLVAGDAGVGRTVSVELLRNKKARTVQVKLGAHPDNAAAAEAAKAAKGKKPAEGSHALGLSVVSLDKDDRGRLKLDAKTQGARVIQVKPGGAAFFAGLRPDDVVQKANGVDVTGAKSFAAVVNKTVPGDVLRLFVLREGTSLFVALEKP